MSANRAWSLYPDDYRAREIEKIAQWFVTNSSGSLVGLPGSGKSNLLGYLCRRPDIVKTLLPSKEDSITLIPVDLNNLPANNAATLYRTILRSFYEISDQFETDLGDDIRTIYLENRNARDPFLSLSALRELLHMLQARQIRSVLVLDRFDKFCRHTPSHMTDTLRGLRDSFKDTLSYIVGMRQEAIYLPDPDALGELFELLDMHVCWVGPLNEADARHLIATVTKPARTAILDRDAAVLTDLSGGYPGLLKAACHWWLTNPDRPAANAWGQLLLEERGVLHRLEEMWKALSQDEQRVLTDVQSTSLMHVLAASIDRRPSGREDSGSPGWEQQDRQTLDRLVEKGVGRWIGQKTFPQRWSISSSLLASYIARVGGRSRGKLWFDGKRKLMYQGRTPLENLSPLESSLLAFLLSRPRIRHTYSELIEATWPEEVHAEGVTTEALYQVVRGLRRQIEPVPSRPQYIINWRGKPEGGYSFFPEGRPG